MSSCDLYRSTGNTLGFGGFAGWVMEGCRKGDDGGCRNKERFALKFQDPESTKLEEEKSLFWSGQGGSPKFIDALYCKADWENPLFYIWQNFNPEKENKLMGVLVTEKLDPETTLEALSPKLDKDEIRAIDKRFIELSQKLDKLGYHYGDPKLDNFMYDKEKDRLYIVDVMSINQGRYPKFMLRRWRDQKG